MSLQSILVPLFVQAGLAFFLLIWMAKEPTALLQLREVKWQDIALRQKAWPDRTQQIANCFEKNQYYSMPLSCWRSSPREPIFCLLSWNGFASRVAHAYVFTTSNYVPLHGQFFIAGTILLLFMWEIFALRILAGPLSGAL
jgi:hypothetical protein